MSGIIPAAHSAAPPALGRTAGKPKLASGARARVSFLLGLFCVGALRGVFLHVIPERALEALRNRAGRGGESVSGDFADAEQAAIGRGDEDFLGGEKIVRAQRGFDDRYAVFRADLEQNAARDALETARIERRRQHFTFAHAENIRGRALGDFAALVQEHDLVVAAGLRFGEAPDVIQPRRDFHSGKWRRGMPAMFAEVEAARFVVRRKVCGAEKQIGWGSGFIALPEAKLVVDDVNPRGAFGDVVHAHEFGELFANAIGLKREGKTDAACVPLQANPMAFVGEGHAVEDAQGGEDAPAAHEARLAGREAHLLEGKDATVMHKVTVNHRLIDRRLSGGDRPGGGRHVTPA